MRRCPSAAAFAFAGAMLAAAAVAQPGTVSGLVRRAGGDLVQSASIRCFERSGLGVEWIDGVLAPSESRTTTDARGVFRVGATGPVLLLVEHGAEGALCSSVHPGAPREVRLAPLGAVELPRGARGAWVAADGIELGRFEGTRLRLPPAVYDVLVEGDGWLSVHSIELAPAGTVALVPPTRTPPRVFVPRGYEVAVLPFASVALGCGPEGVVQLPVASGPLRVRAHRAGPRRVAFEHLWIDPEQRRCEVHDDVQWERLRMEPAAGGSVVATVRWQGGERRVIAISQVDDEGHVAVRRAPEAFAVVVARGKAITCQQVDATTGSLSVVPEARLFLRLVDEDGRGVAGAHVAVLPDDPFLARTLASDARGQVDVFGLAPAVVRVRVDHPAYLPAILDLDAGDPEPHEVVLRPGLCVHGRVTLDGVPRPGVHVVVRDPTGYTGMTPRDAVTGEDGGFAVCGLPDGTFTVFARCDVAGRTWSSQRSDVRPGPDVWTLEVACEDPPLPGERTREDGAPSRRAP